MPELWGLKLLSGKLRSERAHFEKYVAGVVPKSGDTAERMVRHATTDVLLKMGLYGVQVKIAIKNAVPPDIEVKESPKSSVEGTASPTTSESTATGTSTTQATSQSNQTTEQSTISQQPTDREGMKATPRSSRRHASSKKEEKTENETT